MTIEKIIIKCLFEDEKFAKRITAYIPDCIKYIDDVTIRPILEEYCKYFNKYLSIPDYSVVKHHIQDRPTYNELCIQNLNEISKVEKKTYELDWLVKESERYFQDKALEKNILESADILQNKKEGRETFPAKFQDALKISFSEEKAEEYGSEEEIDKQYQHYHTQESMITFPDWPRMNKNLQGTGIGRKRVLCFTSGPNVGKTLHVVNTELQCLKGGYDVIHFTLEDPKQGIFERVDGNILDTQTDDLVYLSKEKYTSKIIEAKNKFKGKFFLREYAGCTINVNHIRMELESLKMKYNFVPDVIGIDYFSLLLSTRFKSFNDSYTYYKSIAEEVRGLATLTNTLVITGTQLNRGESASSNPTKEGTADSFGIPMTFDVQLAIIESDEMKANNIQMYKQLRNRMRPIKPATEKWLIEVNKDKQQIVREMDSSQIVREEYKIENVPEPAYQKSSKSENELIW